MEINDPYRRALALRELSLSMGHHGLQTTVTYYIHRVRAHSHNRYQAILEPSIKSRCSLKREPGFLKEWSRLALLWRVNHKATKCSQR